MTFSLILATVERVEEVERFFNSLEQARNVRLEVVLVDQNEDDRLADLVRKYSAWFPIRHLRMKRGGSSAARNRGLTVCSGDIVAFPDDDCEFPPGLLEKISVLFAQDVDLALVTGLAITADGQISSGRWNETDGPIDVRNVWTSVIEFNMFMKRDVAFALRGFDTDFGIGSKFGSAEGIDLALRAIRAGHKAIYRRDVTVVHPDKRLTNDATARAFEYGTGLGQVLRRHKAPITVTTSFFLRSACGGLKALLLGNRLHFLYYMRSLRGRIVGFVQRDEGPTATGSFGRTKFEGGGCNDIDAGAHEPISPADVNGRCR
jgi:glycosyltransferase involved in cell wall biosynthesis